MAERLTKKITKTIQDKYSLGSYLYYDFNGVENTNRLLNKLGKLEDILEKYGVDIQNLDYILEDYSKNQGRYFAICEEMDDLKKDRNTWQKACELMGEELDMYATKEDNTISTAQYFYQQAKTEGNDE